MSKRTVFKYPISRIRQTRLCLSGPIVHIGLQDDGIERLMVWAEAFVEQPKTRIFEVFGTGHEVPEDAEHVSSVIDGPFVWHIYELKSE